MIDSDHFRFHFQLLPVYISSDSKRTREDKNTVDMSFKGYQKSHYDSNSPKNVFANDQGRNSAYNSPITSTNPSTSLPGWGTPAVGHSPRGNRSRGTQLMILSNLFQCLTWKEKCKYLCYDRLRSGTCFW
jgi:hypothetical protein